METFQSPLEHVIIELFLVLGPPYFSLLLLSHIAHYKNYFLSAKVLGFVTLSVLCAYLHPCKSFSGNISTTFHFLLLAVINELLVLWKQDFVMNTIVLASIFAIVLPIPHILMFLWLCCSLEKKFHFESKIHCVLSSPDGKSEVWKTIGWCTNSISPKWLSEFLELITNG